MKFFNRLKKVKNEAVSAKDINELIDRSSTTKVGDSDGVELTYFVCLKTLSESVGKLGIHLKDGDGRKIFDHPIINLLGTRPCSDIIHM